MMISRCTCAVALRNAAESRSAIFVSSATGGELVLDKDRVGQIGNGSYRLDAHRRVGIIQHNREQLIQRPPCRGSPQ